MAEPTVMCPKCGHRFPLTKALTSQIEESLRSEYDSLSKEREREIESQYRKQAEADRKAIQKQAEAKAKKAASTLLAALQSQLTQATKREKAASARYDRQVASARAQAQREAQKEAKEHVASQLAELTKELNEGQARAEDIELREKAFLQKEAALKAKESSLQKTIQREVEAARRQTATQTAEGIEEDYQQRELEHQKVMQDLKKQLTDARRRLDQSSQQLQGEVRELQLEKALAATCPDDKIRAVRKGKLGADIIHKVLDASAHHCGTIVWEAKNTRAWNKSWITKLRSDQRKEKAELAVLVSTTLPKNVKSHLTQIAGVWVCDFSVATGLAIVLRANLVELARVRGSARGETEKTEILYQYLMSTGFRQRVEAIVEGFVGMRDDLEREKTVTEKAWATREMNIDQVLENVAGMVGDIQAIAPSFPKIRRLELPAPAR
jgi:hypothetical protein